MSRRIFQPNCLRVFALLLAAGWLTAAGSAGQPVYRIMPVGDSITEGGQTFSNYRYLLWEKLFAAGYLVEFVGSRTGESRVGPLRHEAYGGKNAEFLAQVLEQSFPTNIADIVLIHAGHNHDRAEAPVRGIVEATESMIRTARRTNPGVIVLVAQVIPSGKLPKYEYLPELNLALGTMARRLNTPQSPVWAVDMAAGFDWRTDTIADKVHPNAKGAEKMAAKWFAALTEAMAAPSRSYHPRLIPYKAIRDTELTLHVFSPAKGPAHNRHPAIVFFFGGGWTKGTPIQFYPECAHFAEKGFVAISAEYRIASVHTSSPFESVADGKSAIRWVRQHARDLGADPNRVAAAGASAGGQVAAAAGLVPGLDEPGEDQSVSSRPNALVLWYPVVDNGPDGYGPKELKARYREVSPLHNITSNAPPTLFFLGTRDPLIPVSTAEAFRTLMGEAGVRCELVLFPDAGHPIYEYRRGGCSLRDQILREADRFLFDCFR
jgi:acetyl esterase/lipase